MKAQTLCISKSAVLYLISIHFLLMPRIAMEDRIPEKPRRSANRATRFRTVTQCTATALSLGVNTQNQITNSGFTYDASGDMTSDGTYTYTWDARRLLQTAGGVTYTYDGDGKRVMKSSGTLYWNSPDGTPLAETDASGNTLNEYVFFSGNRVARRDSSGNVYYYFQDQLGTEKTIATSAGVVCYDADFLPFGYEMAYTTTCAQNYKFTGLERDSETGLDQTLFRKYDSRLGRWLTLDRHRGDPFNPQSWNRYAYVLNNPLNLTDPLGLWSWSQVGQVALGVVQIGGAFIITVAVAAAEAPTAGTASIALIGASGLLASGATNIIGGLNNAPGSAQAATAVGVVTSVPGYVLSVGSSIMGASQDTSQELGEVGSAIGDVASSLYDVAAIGCTNTFSSLDNANAVLEVGQAASDVLGLTGTLGANQTSTTTETGTNEPTDTQQAGQGEGSASGDGSISGGDYYGDGEEGADGGGGRGEGGGEEYDTAYGDSEDGD